MLWSALLVFYAVGWLNTSIACRFFLRRLSTCDMGMLMVVVPLVELVILFLLSALVMLALEDPIEALLRTGGAVAYLVAGLAALGLLGWIMHKLENACVTVWEAREI